MSYISENSFCQKINKITFFIDPFRVDPNAKNAFHVPNKNNAKWIEALLGEIFTSLLNIDRTIIYGDEQGMQSLRWRVFSKSILPFSVASWAKLYSGGQYQPLITEEIAKLAQNSLIVSYEASDSLIKAMSDENIPYLDFTIHPVRFLDDYMLAARTNVKEWGERLFNLIVPEHYFYEYARIIRAQASRISSFEKVPEGAVLFLAQTAVDSSLICDGFMVDNDMILQELTKLTQTYPIVYYKNHPYFTNKDALNLVKSNKKMELADYNIYMAMGSGSFYKIISFSSGALYESKYFNLEYERILKVKDKFSTELAPCTYMPFYVDILKPSFWGYIFGKSESFEDISHPDPYLGAIKQSSGMKWGK